MLAALLLMSAQSLPSPAQQQRTVASVYRVFYAVKAYGSFTKVVNDEVAVHQESVESDFGLATAFAVDPDGWLITARHVVDMDQLTSEFCRTTEERFTRYRVDRIELDMSLTDIVGNSWIAKYVITPPAGSRADVCHSNGHMTLERESFWPVAIVAVDDVADVGLLKLTQSGGPIAYLEWGDHDGYAAAAARLRVWFLIAKRSCNERGPVGCTMRVGSW